MLTGASSATRASHHAAISSACPLVCGGGEPAAGSAGAGDEAGADRASPAWRGRAPRSRPRRARPCRPARRRSAGSARPSGGYRRRRDRARSSRARASASTVILPTGSTTPIQFRPACFCGCTPICAVRSNAGRGATASAGDARQLAAELLLDGGEKLLEAPGVEHVFQPRLVAVGAVAVLDEDAHDRVGDLRRVLRLAR